MTQTYLSDYKLTKMEYELLKGIDQVPGAAAAIYEFLNEDGVITRSGQLTPFGQEALERYEKDNLPDPDQLPLGL